MSKSKKSAHKAEKPKLNRKSATQILARQQYAELKQVTNLRYDLRKAFTRSQRRTLSKYFDEYEKLTSRPFKVYRPRNKKFKKIAMDYSKQSVKFSAFNVVFVPALDPKAKITFTKSGVMKIKQSAKVTSRVLTFNQLELARNPIAHVNKVIKRDKNAAQFMVIAGNFEIHKPQPRWKIAEYVDFLVGKYPDGEHGYENWLLGLTGYTFAEQSDFIQYAETKKAAIEGRKKDNRALWSRTQRQVERARDRDHLINGTPAEKKRAREKVAKQAEYQRTYRAKKAHRNTLENRQLAFRIRTFKEGFNK